MSFRRHGNKANKVDYKARLEHKLYLARMSPSPVYDISECNLDSVPSSTYLLCEVFRKDTLLLHCNKLKSLSSGGALKNLSLITILDLHSNELNSLPSEIVNLISLKELYLQENMLQELPNEIVRLKNLSILNLSKNKLKYLPEEMGKLKNLTFLDIGYNKNLQKLPKSLGHAQKITHLGIDELKLSYPPGHIQSGGTIVMVAFLANECGIDYAPEKCISEIDAPIDVNLQNVQSLMYNNDNEVQEQRQNALLEVEENIKQQQRQELEMQNQLKINKEKLLRDLANQQVQLDKEIEKVQHKRDVNRTRLLSYIYNAEKEADNVIREFLHVSEEERQAQGQLLEMEKKEEMDILSRTHSEQSLHRTKDTLLAMKDLLEDELLKQKKLADYTAFRDCNAQSLLSLELENNEQLLKVMQDQEKNRQDLVIRVKEDEQLQKALVAALLERSDARSWSIVQQVNLVQSQLAALTTIELERRKYEINQHINDVADKRVTLSAILVSLLEQQEERRRQLLETVKHIEEQRNSLNPSRRDNMFWLLQYQSLIETRPQGLLETLDPVLVRHVAIAGALHCLPFLWTLPSLLPNIDNDQLKDIGVKGASDRAAIMMAVENYLAERKLNAYQYCPPSAPLAEEPSTSSSEQEYTAFEPSAPTECIVCMDFDCEVIFLPCGHFCCCAKCTEMLSMDCPMCRTSIKRKIRITRQ
ncbi:E3 ubiquitin-protein ligase LRSAM1-like isoform X2 [Phymastichus coffea]|uniref:E3 ubiquitin-protein ligase LRSAM1-like isoform X2 n=1 Tax=Phymastichus coffea TaxID=108790 RepID=UPI00273CD094|nr:E3 ubiquitin-protein ligase LRSAM1-like isoform X2 [Phymastichus coffea]